MKRYDKDAPFKCPKCGTLTEPDRVVLCHWGGSINGGRILVTCPRCGYEERMLPLDAPEKSP